MADNARSDAVTPPDARSSSLSSSSSCPSPGRATEHGETRRGVRSGEQGDRVLRLHRLHQGKILLRRPQLPTSKMFKLESGMLEVNCECTTTPTSTIKANDADLEPTSGSGLGAPPRATSSCCYRQGLRWCCFFWAGRGLQLLPARAPELLPVLSWTAPSSCYFWAGRGLELLPARAPELLLVLSWTVPSSCCCCPQLRPAAATNLGPHGAMLPTVWRPA